MYLYYFITSVCGRQSEILAWFPCQACDDEIIAIGNNAFCTDRNGVRKHIWTGTAIEIAGHFQCEEMEETIVLRETDSAFLMKNRSLLANVTATSCKLTSCCNGKKDTVCLRFAKYYTYLWTWDWMANTWFRLVNFSVWFIIFCVFRECLTHVNEIWLMRLIDGNIHVKYLISNAVSAACTRWHTKFDELCCWRRTPFSD